MKVINYCDSAFRLLRSWRTRRISAVALLLLLLAPLGVGYAQEDRGRAEQRAQMQEANRERMMQRQQETLEQRTERSQQREQLQLQRRNQLGIPPQFERDPSGFQQPGAPENWRDRRGLSRMTPEERQALRRQIQEAGRSVYPAPPPNR